MFKLAVMDTELVDPAAGINSELKPFVAAQYPAAEFPPHVEVFAFSQGTKFKSAAEMKTHKNSLRSFTMTDEDGVHIFGHCLMSYMPLKQTGNNGTTHFRPCCLCIVTTLPFHCSFRRFLTCYVDARSSLNTEPKADGDPAGVSYDEFGESDLRTMHKLLQRLESDLNPTWGQPVHIELGPHLVSFTPPSSRPDICLPLADVDFDAIFSVLPAEAFLQVSTNSVIAVAWCTTGVSILFRFES